MISCKSYNSLVNVTIAHNIPRIKMLSISQGAKRYCDHNIEINGVIYLKNVFIRQFNKITCIFCLFNAIHKQMVEHKSLPVVL